MTDVFTITALVTLCFSQVIFLTEGKKCLNPPPGIPKMFRGVDITKVDLLPIESFGDDGFYSPVVKYTCDKGETWKSPNGKVYELPDQILQMTSLPGGWMTADAEFYRSSQELKKSFGVDVGFEANVKGFAFSSSVSYTSMQSTLTNSSKYISDVGAFVSANTAEMNPNIALPLNDFAKAVVDKDLTGTYESNPNSYNKFINTYGTHFFFRANFGGYIRAIYRIDTRYFATSSEESVKVNAKASFMNIISISAGTSSGKSQVDESFTKSSSQSIRYYGGNTNLLGKGSGLTEWQPTVANDPWLFSGKLRPISDLFTNATKKSSMERAVEQYMMRSYVGELERLVSYAKSKSNDAVLNNLQTRVQSLRNTTVLVSKDVKALGADVDFQIKPPTWFADSTKLCFKWSATDDPGQCGRWIPNELCAKPNSMTQTYLDDTDNRKGGCRMEWGIFSSVVYPAWFDQVKMCFSYEPTGDTQCTQCGDGYGKTWCVKVQSYTPTYVDYTYNKPGGCAMTWSMQVPSTAPLWMKTAQLCFSWKNTGGQNECGKGPPNDICVNANEWTPRYIDDTYDWGGGCEMSWGIRTVLI